MFDSASIAHDVGKATWKRKEPPLRQALLATQDAVLEKKAFPVLVLIGGVEGAGKGETVNLLDEWMDPRHLITHAFDAPSQEERQRRAVCDMVDRTSTEAAPWALVEASDEYHARLTVLSPLCAAIERRFDER